MPSTYFVENTIQHGSPLFRLDKIRNQALSNGADRDTVCEVMIGDVADVYASCGSDKGPTVAGKTRPGELYELTFGELQKLLDEALGVTARQRKERDAQRKAEKETAAKEAAAEAEAEAERAEEQAATAAERVKALKSGSGSTR